MSYDRPMARDEQSDPGSRYHVVEHVVRPGWDGPGLVRCMGCWDGLEQANAIAARLTPTGPWAVGIRVLDQRDNTWVDNGEPAFKRS